MLENECEGGESIIVDGWKVAEDLRKENPEYFDILQNFNVPFRQFDENNETAHNIYNYTAEKLGQGLAQAATLLEPEAFIFYGGQSPHPSWVGHEQLPVRNGSLCRGLG